MSIFDNDGWLMHEVIFSKFQENVEQVFAKSEEEHTKQTNDILCMAYIEQVSQKLWIEEL